jgi:putative flippase GtrA
MRKTAGNAGQGVGAVASFMRFVACGGGVTVLSGTALLMLDNVMPLALANAVLAVAGTAITTELNARFAFRSGPTGWTVHLQAASTVLVAYLFTTGAMLTLAGLEPNPDALVQQAAYLSASGLAGIGRFLVLRAFVLVLERPEPVEALVPVDPHGGGGRLLSVARGIHRRMLALVPTRMPAFS